MRDRPVPLDDEMDTLRRDRARYERRFDALIDELRALKQAGPAADPEGARRWTLLAELGLVIGKLGEQAVSDHERRGPTDNK